MRAALKRAGRQRHRLSACRFCSRVGTLDHTPPHDAPLFFRKSAMYDYRLRSTVHTLTVTISPRAVPSSEFVVQHSWTPLFASSTAFGFRPFDKFRCPEKRTSRLQDGGACGGHCACVTHWLVMFAPEDRYNRRADEKWYIPYDPLPREWRYLFSE